MRHLHARVNQLANLLDPLLRNTGIKQNRNGNSRFRIPYHGLKIRHDHVEQTKQENASRHRRNRRQREQLILPDIYDSLFDCIEKSANPHSRHPPRRPVKHHQTDHRPCRKRYPYSHLLRCHPRQRPSAS